MKLARTRKGFLQQSVLRGTTQCRLYKLVRLRYSLEAPFNTYVSCLILEGKRRKQERGKGVDVGTNTS